MQTPTEYPLISVIVPTYERSTLLPRALDSIFAQTWPNIEVVVVDDNIPGSSWEAETAAVLVPYRDRPNFVYLKTTGKTGGGAARNFAIRRCTGDYVAFLDDDDRFLPDKLEKQYRFIEEYDLDGCYQDVKWVDSNEKLVELRSMDYTDDYSTESLLRAHILHSICPTAIYMFRRDKLLLTEGFGEVITGQDFYLMLRCIESGMKLRYMPGAYVVQYLHEGARISLGTNKIKGENNLYALKHRYFHLLTPAQRRYVRFRHYAVLSFASLRSHRPLRAAGYAFVTVCSSPALCVKEGIRYFRSKFGG
ncbi:MAG: glycosyltransferase family 2 protein [Oscillospiraceae bacterium]|nr:glycosyltransferase family 2 protein [Oscillospiraceae bacterium]